MFDNTSGYAVFKEQQAQMAQMLSDGSEAISVLNMNQYKENLSVLSKKVGDETFKIQVTGTFSNGKSSVINALFGQEILPAYVTPTTAVINEVKYGKKKKAILYFKHPLPDPLPNCIPPKTLAHMRKYDAGPIPPIEVSCDELEDYVVMPLDEKDPRQMLLESPYERVELFWPLDLLEKSVELIDSPGLNAFTAHTQITTNNLSRVDAVLFVLNSGALCSLEEMKFIESTIRGKGFEDLFFLANKFDTISDNQKERVKKYAYMKLKDLSTLGNNGIFFVSALKALEGKQNGDVDAYKASGMYDFERALSDFLVKQKGKAKLTQPARELRRILSEEALYKIIPQQRAMLDSSLMEIKRRYEEAKPQLDLTRKKKDQMKERAHQQIRRALPEVRRYISHYFSDLCLNIPAWINDLEVEASISLNPFKTKESIKDVCNEIIVKMTAIMEDSQALWVKNMLEPFVSETVAELNASLESSADAILLDLDSVRSGISGISQDGGSVLPSGGSRAGAAIIGFLLGFGGGGMTGSITGFNKDFAKAIAGNLAAYLAIIAIFGLNPFALVPAVIISIVAGGISGQSATMRKVKAMISEKLLESIQAESAEKIGEMVCGIESELYEYADVIVSGLDAEISSIDVQVQDIISQIEQGQAQVDEKKAVLTACEDQLKKLSTDLDNFIFQLIGS